MSLWSPVFDDAHALKCELAAEVLRSSGMLRLRATGRSMLPAIWPGDTLAIERASGDDVSEGDIVLFQRNGRFVAHRVVSKSNEPEGSTIQTRGDAVSRLDVPLSGYDLLGKVSFILRDGKCIEPSRSLRFSERAVAALVRSSEIAARAVVGVHGLHPASLK